jgi:hypothetical protein
LRRPWKLPERVGPVGEARAIRPVDDSVFSPDGRQFPTGMAAWWTIGRPSFGLGSIGQMSAMRNARRCSFDPSLGKGLGRRRVLSGCKIGRRALLV